LQWSCLWMHNFSLEWVVAYLWMHI
jgi:hypothetical protein